MDINQISNRTILRILGLITLFVGVIWLSFLLKRQITWVVIAVFFTLALNPLVEYLRKFVPKKSRAVTSAIVVFGSFIIGIAIVASFVPLIVGQTGNLVNDIPKTVEAVTNSNTPVGTLFRRYEVIEYVNNNQEKVVNSATSLSQPVLNGLRSALSSLVGILTIVSLTYFMLAEGADWLHKLATSRFGRRYKDLEPVVGDMYGAVSGYVAGNLATSGLAAISTAIILSILGVPYAIPLAILVGVFDMLPLIGATLGAAIVLFFTLFQSIPSTIIMFVFFLVYQQIENQFIQPMVYAKTVQISPLIVFLAALFGASLAGIIGAIIAIPVAASIKIILSYYFGTVRPKNLAKSVK
jgi:predicted PurR-regulated permease PerM